MLDCMVERKNVRSQMLRFSHLNELTCPMLNLTTTDLTPSSVHWHKSDSSVDAVCYKTIILRNFTVQSSLAISVIYQAIWTNYTLFLFWKYMFSWPLFTLVEPVILQTACGKWHQILKASNLWKYIKQWTHFRVS